MKLNLSIGNRFYTVKFLEPIDISIPIHFSGQQVQAFGADRAKASPLVIDTFTGDTRRGGSCNCETIQITPHCNGTHTEGVGHLMDERISISQILTSVICPSTLITVEPEEVGEARVISVSILEKLMSKTSSDFLEGLIVRTLPNPTDKSFGSHLKNSTPYFSPDSTAWMVQKGVMHLICDLPSIDPLKDGGVLAAHRNFWELPPGAKATTNISKRTITELAYIPSQVSDGNYLLSLTPAPWTTDATPSRPLLFPLHEEGSK